MKVAILQPGYLPWLGFFEQVYQADLFILYNDVQYTKQDWRNRNRIKTPHGVQYLTVPVGKVPTHTLIQEVRLPKDSTWKEKHLRLIRQAYQHAPYFALYFEPIGACIQADYAYLQDLDAALIRLLCGFLGLQDRQFCFSSDITYRKTTDKSLNLLNICLSVGASALYDGLSARRFLNLTVFRQHGIAVTFQDYVHPVYPQLFGRFVPHLSVIDLLFNTGPQSLDYLTGNRECSIDLGFGKQARQK